MPPAEPTRSLRRALTLGLIQGPSELLPISSSAHTSLLPWLAGRGGCDPPGGRSRSFELALHGGGSLALALEMIPPLSRELRPAGAVGALSGALTLLPPAIAGFALRGVIERRLSGPRASAFGLIAGAGAMVVADRGGPGGRPAADVRPVDGLLLGLAQALALAPGVSRNGATLTAARGRGFSRAGAQRLSWAAGLPVMGGASAVEALRLARGGTLERPAGLVGGALAAFISTRLSARLLARALERGPLWPFSLYRFLLAAVILVRAGRAQ